MSLFFFLLFLLSCTSSVLSTSNDEKVLLKIKQQLGNPSMLSDWVKGFDICHTYRTKCNSNGRVSGIYLEQFDDVTTFPKAICALTELGELIIRDCPGFYGAIPSCVAKVLPNLKELDIRSTSFSGSLPKFYNHTNITSITISRSKFSGKIPSSLATCPKLNYLDVSSNNLTGKIPSGLAISTLILEDNFLTGKIPVFYGSMSFSTFNVWNNSLSGDPSFLFGYQKMTESILLSYNNFTFDLTNAQFSNHLLSLDLRHNNIYGKVPPSAVTVMYLNLSYNKLCGEIPQGGLISMYKPDFFSNNLCLCGYPLPPCSSSGPALPPTGSVPSPPF